MKVLPRILLALILTAGISLALTHRGQLGAEALTGWVASAGPAGPLVFMGVYAIGTVLFLPGSLLTLAGGALFGPVWGTVYNLTGATLGAVLAFLAARNLAAGWVQARAGGLLGRLVHGVEAEGWRFVAFTRLVPLFPFNLLNFALGLTRIPFLHYLIASAVCMLPGAIAYTWLGYAGREAAAGGADLVQKALNLPLEDLPERLTDLGDDPERPIALVCRTDRRSAKAATLLAQHGFATVQVVQGGMTAWLDRGWPVERNPTQPE